MIVRVGDLVNFVNVTRTSRFVSIGHPGRGSIETGAGELAIIAGEDPVQRDTVIVVVRPGELRYAWIHDLEVIAYASLLERVNDVEM